MKKLLQKKIAGFSLVEALVAALVVGIGVLGMAKLQGHMFKQSAESRMRSQAMDLAQGKIEQFRGSLNFANMASGADNPSDPELQSNSGSFARSWVVNPCPNNAADCRKIDVTVAWTDSAGTNQQVNLSSNVSGGQSMSGSGANLSQLSGGSGSGGKGVFQPGGGSDNSTSTTAPAQSTTTTAAPVTTTTAAPVVTTTTAPPAPTTTVAPTTTTTANVGSVPTGFTMLAPSGCGTSSGQACKFDRGAKDGETVQISFQNNKGTTITNPTVSITIPSINIAKGQEQPSVVGTFSISSGIISFKVRGPGCCSNGGSWVGLTNTSFQIIVTVNGVPFTVYMKTDA